MKEVAFSISFLIFNENDPFSFKKKVVEGVLKVSFVLFLVRTLDILNLFFYLLC